MRLIDADALKESMRGKFFDSVEEWTAIREIDEAPTIEPKRGRKWPDFWREAWLKERNKRC